MWNLYETEQEVAEPSSSGGQQQEDVLKADMGQGIRRRRPLEDGTGERERKCSKFQTQERGTRQDWEEGGEMDIEGKCLEDEGAKGKKENEGVLRKVKSISSKSMGEGGKGDEEEGVRGEEEEWIEVSVGKGRGKKSLGKESM